MTNSQPSEAPDPRAEAERLLKRGFHVTDIGVADVLRALLAALTAKDEELRSLREASAGAAIRAELAEARLRGWSDFFSGQPRDLPFKGESDSAAKESQLNVAWCIGYDSASESDLWNLMVGRADRLAAKCASPSPSALAIAEQLEYSARILRAQHVGLWLPVVGYEGDLDGHMRVCRENHLGCAYLQAVEGMEKAAAILRAGQQEQKEQK